jgi:hypothetical protein
MVRRCAVDAIQNFAAGFGQAALPCRKAQASGSSGAPTRHFTLFSLSLFSFESDCFFISFYFDA